VTLAPGDLGIDYSYARPDLAEAAKSGAKFVIRYTAGVASLPAHPSYALNKGKLIGPIEFNSILHAGMDVIANDEWYQTRVTEGAAAGTADARAAAGVWQYAGLAKGAAIYPSWDANPGKAQWPKARAYLLAYAAEMEKHGYKLGLYAGTPFLRYATSGAFGRFAVRFLWRPNAGSWSGDGLPYQPDTSTPEKRAALVKVALAKTPACIWQTGNYWFSKSADEDMILRVPVGSHLEAAVPDPTPHPTPPAPLPTGRNPKMFVVRVDPATIPVGSTNPGWGTFDGRRWVHLAAAEGQTNNGESVLAACGQKVPATITFEQYTAWLAGS
jgi:hypothetical protein